MFFRFLIGLANPLDRANTESMVLMGLNLLTVALEAGADHIRNYTLLMALVKNELCRSLIQVFSLRFCRQVHILSKRFFDFHYLS